MKYVPETCKEGRGIWLVGLYIRCVRRAGNDAREKIEVEEEDTEGWKRITKPTLLPLSALQLAFFAPLERAGALSPEHVEPQPRQRALPRLLAWAQ